VEEGTGGFSSSTRLKFWEIRIFSPGHIHPGQFPPWTIPPPFSHSVGHHDHLPIGNIKRSAVNMYKIVSGRSVRVRSSGLCQFSNLHFNSRGDVLGGEENCPGGDCLREYVLQSCGEQCTVTASNSVPGPGANRQHTSCILSSVGGL